jgi:hypothetical protein
MLQGIRAVGPAARRIDAERDSSRVDRDPIWGHCPELALRPDVAVRGQHPDARHPPPPVTLPHSGPLQRLVIGHTRTPSLAHPADAEHGSVHALITANGAVLDPPRAGGGGSGRGEQSILQPLPLSLRHHRRTVSWHAEGMGFDPEPLAADASRLDGLADRVSMFVARVRDLRDEIDELRAAVCTQLEWLDQVDRTSVSAGSERAGGTRSAASGLRRRGARRS